MDENAKFLEWEPIANEQTSTPAEPLPSVPAALELLERRKETYPKIEAWIHQVRSCLASAAIFLSEADRLRSKFEAENWKVFELTRSPVSVAQRLNYAKLHLTSLLSVMEAARRENLVKKPKSGARHGADDSDQEQIENIRILIQKINSELREQGYPRREKHKAICERLHDHPRPPGAAWIDLAWDRAYDDPKFQKIRERLDLQGDWETSLNYPDYRNHLRLIHNLQLLQQLT